EPEQAFVEQEHAVLAAGLDAGVDAVRLVFANEVHDGGRDDHHFVGGDHALGLFGKQGLGQHADEGGRQLSADLVLLLLGKHVDDAVNGTGGTAGVQGAE